MHFTESVVANVEPLLPSAVLVSVSGYVWILFSRRSPEGSITTCWCGSLPLLPITALNTAAITRMSSSCASRPFDWVSFPSALLQHSTMSFWLLDRSHLRPLHLSFQQTQIQKRMSLSSTWRVNRLEGSDSWPPVPNTASVCCPSLWWSAKVVSKPEQTRRWAVHLPDVARGFRIYSSAPAVEIVILFLSPSRFFFCACRTTRLMEKSCLTWKAGRYSAWRSTKTTPISIFSALRAN